MALKLTPCRATTDAQTHTVPWRYQSYYISQALLALVSAYALWEHPSPSPLWLWTITGVTQRLFKLMALNKDHSTLVAANRLGDIRGYQALLIQI